ncbi:FAD/NAD(P)-binding domain-containing protein [Aspergillus steynii IBT 23096]|uniref:FAD/NAD(P)-binding domain-containing protein n=1 Tax=Aspergillus steynii IBT 23096 TaxID=1392250 RepID=A0A2I2G6C9_9EURO|nr:FAD/NAD(P)-binding domain-containing protein [Aspergillus steynii IBT 23096]PLB48434.1 FAD/NAD(P)-binding domain-containing protein [Aspergillus steynii IBT 23096]
MLSLTTSIFGLVAVAPLVSAASQSNVLNKDVVIVGGGASGAYAAVRIRDDFGKSIALVEKESILGGHVDSYVDPQTGTPYDYGVKTFLDTGNATGFFDRFGIARGSSPTVPVTTEYIDFLTGETVNFTAPPMADQMSAMAKFLDIVEPWESLMQPSYTKFPVGDDIPSDLLLPYADFITKHGLQDAVPLMYQSTGLGLGNMAQETTLFVLQGFGASMARAMLGKQNMFVPASGRNQDLYDAVADSLHSDILYSSTVVRSKRSASGVSLTVQNHKTNETTVIHAKRLLLAIEPTASNMAPFDLDADEQAVFDKFVYSNEYTGLVDNRAFATNASYFNLPASAAPSNYLALPDPSFTARIDYFGGAHLFRVTVVGDQTLDAAGAKKLVQKDFDTLLEAGRLTESRKQELSWVDFSAHGPMHARVSVADVKDGYFKKLYGLQGGRSTWWTGGAFSVNFQTTLWEFDELLIPELLEGLN